MLSDGIIDPANFLFKEKRRMMLLRRIHSTTPYLLALLLLTSGFTALNLGARALTGRSRLVNPFAVYITVFPGQPRSAVPGRGFTCPMSAYSSSSSFAEEICVAWPKDGVFSQVTVASTHDRVQQITFILQPERLQVGDLVLLWGRPDMELSSHAIYLHWPQHRIFAVTGDYEGRFSFTLPIHQVILGRPVTEP
jgi:hypothetical protein